MYVSMLVTNCYQILKRASEGIAERDGAGHTANGAFDLHRPMWIKKLTASVTRSPTNSGQEPDFFLHIKIFKFLKLIKNIKSYVDN